MDIYSIVENIRTPEYSHIRLSKKCSQTEHYNMIEKIFSHLREISVERVKGGFHLTGHGDNYVVQVTPTQIEISCIPTPYHSLPSIMEDSESIFGVSLDRFRIKQLGYRITLITNYQEVKAALGQLAIPFDKEDSGYEEQLYRSGKPALLFNSGYPDFCYSNSDKQLNISAFQMELLREADFWFLTFELSYFRRFPSRIRDKYLADLIENPALFNQELTFQFYQSYRSLRKQSTIWLPSPDSHSQFYAALDAELERVKKQYSW